MKHVMLSTLLCCAVGCTTQHTVSRDFFAGESEFSAAREREITRLPATSLEAAYVHVVHALLDLDCSLGASHRELGVVSATGAQRLLSRGRFAATPLQWQGCAGHRVTVTVSKLDAGAVAVRATFDPPSAAADQAFRVLLRRSFSLDARQVVSHAP